MSITAVRRTPAAPMVPAAAFSCRRALTGATVRVTLRGELDIATAPRLHDALCEAHAQASTVVLDLRRLEFSDCCGARVMIAADQRIRRDGGRLLIVRAPAEVQWFFTLIGLDHQLQFVALPPDELAASAVRAREPIGPGACAPEPATA